MSYKTYLKQLYFDPEKPGSYGSVNKLYRAVRKEGKYVLGKSKIKKWLESQEAFGLHRQINRTFPRRKMIIPSLNYFWEADTAVMTSYDEENDNYRYFLLVVNAFSKYVWTIPLKSTKGIEMVSGLSSVLDGNSIPWHLRTDRGSEFKNKEVGRLLKKMGVKHFFSSNEKKSCFAERAIKTIKSKLSRYMTRHQTHRWIDVLKSVTDSYNGTYHRTIKMSPKSVTKKDEIRLWKMQYHTNSGKPTPAFKFNIGDHVRISHLRKPFHREYDERWTMEYFVVDSRYIKQGMVNYTLKDTLNEEVLGSFYQPELSRVQVTDDMIYRVDKVLRKRKNQVLVSWLGWPQKYSSWIPANSLKDYKNTTD